MRIVVAATVAACAVPASGASRPASTLSDLGRALTACFQAPAGSAGDAITVKLSLTRSGAVLGKPLITAVHLVGRDDERRAFVAAALTALAHCTPVAVTPGLGGAIAGRPFAVRFIGGEPERPI